MLLTEWLKLADCFNPKMITCSRNINKLAAVTFSFAVI